MIGWNSDILNRGPPGQSFVKHMNTYSGSRVSLSPPWGRFGASFYLNEGGGYFVASR